MKCSWMQRAVCRHGVRCALDAGAPLPGHGQCALDTGAPGRPDCVGMLRVVRRKGATYLWNGASSGPYGPAMLSVRP